MRGVSIPRGEKWGGLCLPKTAKGYIGQNVARLSEGLRRWKDSRRPSIVDNVYGADCVPPECQS